VIALAYADGAASAPSLADGLVRSGAVDGADRLRSNIQTSIQLGLGTSGAPVFGPDGKVIGMVSLLARDGAQVSTYAVPIRHGRNLLQPQATR
jgi:S1-C subfamily serine protease